MSQRYTQGYDENKNVVNPDFFEEGMHTHAGEWNGGLDRDNFPQANLLRSEVDTQGGTVRVFTDYRQSYASDNTYTPDMATTQWQGGTDNDLAGIFYRSWTSLQDEHVDIHANLSWSWSGSYSHVGFGVRPTHTDTFDTVMYQIVVDGIVLATAGPFEDGAVNWSAYLCCSAQLAAGEHTIRMECLVVRRVAQSGALDGRCTNTLSIESRSLIVVRSFR